jgi:drug/metabolite transporter (DMT)-like permease
MELALGILAGVAASTFYSLGIAFQALDARDAPHHEHLRVALVWRLVQRARWLLGTALGALGWPCQVVAFLLAPVVVVQPTLATGLLVLMVAGERLLGERPGRYEYLAVGAILLGVAGTAVFAPPRSDTHGGDLTITLVLVALGLASLVPYILRSLGRAIAEVTILGAGLAYGWSAIATKLASDDLASGHYAVAAAWGLSTAAASGVGILSEMSALQARPAILVAPVVFVIQTVVPVVSAPLLLGENFTATALGGFPLSVALLVLIAGAAALARSPLLLALTAADRTSEDSGTTPSLSPDSAETIRSSPARPDEEPPSSTTSTSPARSVR